ncbi:MAG: DsbA family protein, partial [Gemmatimonadetes bacterium]|nr:DsbA family protein [Gemmatimonadota bacterium]
SGPGRTFYMIVGAVLVVGVVALLVARAGGGDPGPALIPVTLADTEESAEAGVSAGPEDAVVTLVEFADFQCPACARFYSFSGRLIKQNYVDGGGSVRWVFYDFPLDQHPHAVPAAQAARCAGEQGLFWPMHDLLFARQAQWSPKDDARGEFEDYAKELGLDRGEYRACMREGRHLEEIFASAKYGAQLGVNSTPTIFVNGVRASQDYESLEEMIREAAAAAETGGDGADEGDETEGGTGAP